MRVLSLAPQNIPSSIVLAIRNKVVHLFIPKLPGNALVFFAPFLACRPSFQR